MAVENERTGRRSFRDIANAGLDRARAAGETIRTGIEEHRERRDETRQANRDNFRERIGDEAFERMESNVAAARENPIICSRGSDAPQAEAAMPARRQPSPPPPRQEPARPEPEPERAPPPQPRAPEPAREPARTPPPPPPEPEPAPEPELEPEQEAVIEELEPQIMEAAIDTVVQDTGSEELSAEDKEEAERRMNRVRQALTNILRWDGEKGKNALRKLAHTIEAFSAGWNGNPSQITEQILEEHRAQRDHAHGQDDMRLQGDIALEQDRQSQDFQREQNTYNQDFQREQNREGQDFQREQNTQDQDFQREMQQIENEFAWDMRRFDAMDEQERMMLADRLNREMARLERELGDAAFETHLALTLANTVELKELVEQDPYRWARLVRAISGIDPGTHASDLIGRWADRLIPW